jgi:N-acetylmuramoyl-L-alanine amidase
MNPSIHDQPLPYVDLLPERPALAVELVVIHCTELPDLAMAREYGEKVLHASGAGNSGHYYIDRDGAIYRYVPATRVANHVRGHNPNSIGIELVNRGRYPRWWDSRHQQMEEPYADAQIAALNALLEQLRVEFPNLRHIAGHEELDTALIPASDDPALEVHRKLDPGPLFPWDAIVPASGLRRLVLSRMSDQPHVRTALPADAERLAVLAAQTFRDTFAGDNSPEDMQTYVRDAFSADLVQAELADRANTFLLAFTVDAELPTGYAKLRRGTADPCVTGPDPIELQRVYVDRSALGLGVGAALMQASLEAARSAGQRTLWLGVWEHNARAIAFYEKWGFETVGDHVFRLGSDDQRDLIMQRPVPEPD